MSKPQTLFGLTASARPPADPAAGGVVVREAGREALVEDGNGRYLAQDAVTLPQEAPPVAAPGGARHVLGFEKPLAQLEQQIADLERTQTGRQVDYTAELRELRENYTSLLRKTYDGLGAWETVQVARHPQRPLFVDYVEMIFREFREIHGDRRYGDDLAIRCGLSKIGGHKVMLIGHHKGRDTKEKIKCMFGLANPEGYRKALRAMKLAEKFKLPVVTLVDTPGAYPGIGAEERGQAESIAVNLMEMSRLQTPIVSVIIGEGGSGGALGIAVADRVAMSQYAWYSVISPEACSSILFKDGTQAARMAEALKLTSKDLKWLGVIDAIVPEPLGGAHRDPHQAAHHLEQFLAKTLRELKRRSLDELLGRATRSSGGWGSLPSLPPRHRRRGRRGEMNHPMPSTAPAGPLACGAAVWRHDGDQRSSSDSPSSSSKLQPAVPSPAAGTASRASRTRRSRRFFFIVVSVKGGAQTARQKWCRTSPPGLGTAPPGSTRG